MRPATLTLSLETCPACDKPHHLPLVFLEQADGTYKAQCTWTLKTIIARMSETERLEVEK